GVCVNRAPAITAIDPFADPGAEPRPALLTTQPDTDVLLNMLVEDDGLPLGSKVSLTWKKTSGPGVVTFASSSAASTRARFSALGEYELELSGSDGEATGVTRVKVTVSNTPRQSPPPVPTAATGEKPSDVYVKMMRDINAAAQATRRD